MAHLWLLRAIPLRGASEHQVASHVASESKKEHQHHPALLAAEPGGVKKAALKAFNLGVCARQLPGKDPDSLGW